VTTSVVITSLACMRSELRGLVGVADPLRPGVPEAVRACTGAGIRVAMITGDHPAKAAAIARQASIPAERVLTGSEMSEMDNAALREAIQHVSCSPASCPSRSCAWSRRSRARGRWS
jgi:Ca2+-transporting ATPase